MKRSVWIQCVILVALILTVKYLIPGPSSSSQEGQPTAKSSTQTSPLLAASDSNEGNLSSESMLSDDYIHIRDEGSKWARSEQAACTNSQQLLDRELQDTNFKDQLSVLETVRLDTEAEIRTSSKGFEGLSKQAPGALKETFDQARMENYQFKWIVACAHLLQVGHALEDLNITSRSRLRTNTSGFIIGAKKELLENSTQLETFAQTSAALDRCELTPRQIHNEIIEANSLVNRAQYLNDTDLNATQAWLMASHAQFIADILNAHVECFAAWKQYLQTSQPTQP